MRSNNWHPEPVVAIVTLTENTNQVNSEKLWSWLSGIYRHLFSFPVNNYAVKFSKSNELWQNINVSNMRDVDVVLGYHSYTLSL